MIIKKRIGNDLEIRWSIVTGSDGNTAPYNLEGKDLTLILHHMYGDIGLGGFSVSGNVIQAVYRGKDQEWCGEYSVILVENYGKDGMLTVDKCDAFELVACSCDESEKDSSGRVNVTKVDLGTDSMFAYVWVIDDALSLTSGNAVQNKVVTSALEEKVDKESGKGLSTNDLTDALLSKLLNTENYNDAELRELVEANRVQIEKILSGDSDGKINNLADIIALLSGFREGDNLKVMMTTADNSNESSITAVRRDMVNGLADKQNIRDNSLTTESKTVIGAINELQAKKPGEKKSNGGEVFNEAHSARGNYSHAEGWRTQSDGEDSHAEGTYSTAIGKASHAEGWCSYAVGMASHAEGQDTTAKGDNSHAEGILNIEDADAIHQVGIGHFDDITDEAVRKDAHCIKRTGEHFILGIGGFDGTNSNEAGVKDLATVVNSLSSGGGGGGYAPPADGIPLTDLAQNVQDTINSVSSKQDKTDTNLSTTSKQIVGAINELKSADENFVRFDKAQTLSTTQQSQALTNIGAVGRKTEQGGEVFNVYEGEDANVAGDSAHAEGGATTASGLASHAEGILTIAEGQGAHAEGAGTIAKAKGAHAEGLNNVADTNAIHQVGIGRHSSARRDAHNIKQDGRHYILNVGGFDGTNSNAEGVKDLATVIADLESSGGGSGTGVDAYTKSETDNLLNGKQDTISDLATIRSNASDGKTAYGWGNHATMGYLTEHQSLADYALKSEIPNTANLATKAEVQAKQDAITTSNKLSYSLIKDTPTIPSIEGLATEAMVSAKADKVSQVTHATFSGAITLNPNTRYVINSATGDITISYGSPSSGYANEYNIVLTPSSAISVTFGAWSGNPIKWAGGVAPTIEANKTIEISVQDGLGVWQAYE